MSLFAIIIPKYLRARGNTSRRWSRWRWRLCRRFWFSSFVCWWRFFLKSLLKRTFKLIYEFLNKQTKRSSPTSLYTHTHPLISSLSLFLFDSLSHTHFFFCMHNLSSIGRISTACQWIVLSKASVSSTATTQFKTVLYIFCFFAIIPPLGWLSTGISTLSKQIPI